MWEKIKLELLEILLAIVKALRVLVVYIFPSVLVAIVFIPDLATLILEQPKTLLPYLVNAIVLALVTYLQPKYDALKGELPKEQE